MKKKNQKIKKEQKSMKIHKGEVYTILKGQTFLNKIQANND